MHFYRQILYFISAVILVTLVIQVYYNIKQYDAGKQSLHREVQIATDQALDNYYIDLADKNTIGFAMDQSDPIAKRKLDSLLKRIDMSSQGKKGFDSLDSENISEVKVFAGSRITHMDTFFDNIKVSKKDKKQALRHFLNGTVNDSLNDLAKLTSRIIVAITTDTLNVQELTPYIKKELMQRNISLPFAFTFKNKSGNEQVYNGELNNADSNPVTSRSAYLPKKSSFTLYYDKITPIVLKRSLLPISLSAVLIAAVIGCLLFLLKIINKQKQLAELKNDLISNITHEFKTPIATIGVALEGIENFNKKNNPKKTKSYVRTSSVQLEKLNLMVEKLLETETLDSNELELKKEEIELIRMLQNLIKRHKSLAPDKDFYFESFPDSRQLKHENKVIEADALYLENALNNILDNAVKYGGNQIKVILKTENRHMIIKITDSGNKLTPSQTKQIFDKFYRVPKGNIHDVKGFGIGLYFTKKIIEKHGGSVEVDINKETTFTIILPNG